jgi:hypothetical protein
MIPSDDGGKEYFNLFRGAIVLRVAMQPQHVLRWQAVFFPAGSARARFILYAPALKCPGSIRRDHGVCPTSAGKLKMLKFMEKSLCLSPVCCRGATSA